MTDAPNVVTVRSQKKNDSVRYCLSQAQILAFGNAEGESVASQRLDERAEAIAVQLQEPVASKELRRGTPVLTSS